MRSLLPLSALALIAASLLFCGVAAQAEDLSADAAPSTLEVTPFSFYDYIAGEWEVYRHTASFKDGSVSYESSLPTFRWRLEKENHTSNLFGVGWSNGTSAEDASLSLRLEMHDTASGKFQAGSDADDLATLFDFSFTQARGSVPMSVGVWKGAETGESEAVYTFQASSPDRFTITIIPRTFDLASARRAAQTPKPSARKTAGSGGDEEDEELTAAGPASAGHELLSAEDLAGAEAIIFVGHRHKVEPEKTFFQRYGTFLMLGAMLILNVWMRTRQSTQMATQQARIATATSAAAGAAAGKVPATDAGAKKAQ